MQSERDDSDPRLELSDSELACLLDYYDEELEGLRTLVQTQKEELDVWCARLTEVDREKAIEVSLLRTDNLSLSSENKVYHDCFLAIRSVILKEASSLLYKIRKSLERGDKDNTEYLVEMLAEVFSKLIRLTPEIYKGD